MALNIGIRYAMAATTGQNGVRQAQEFSRAGDVTGAVLTKLDGSAKGGVALAIASELGIPVKLIGIGESLDDLRLFDATEFARALIEEGQSVGAGGRSRGSARPTPVFSPALALPGTQRITRTL
jgi:flagellar biosynthesis GTPase FlhF